MIKLTKSGRLFVFITFLFWFVFFVGFWAQGHFVKAGDLYAKSLGTWADGAAHLTYISNIAYGTSFPHTLPLFLGKSYIYPFAADLIAALLVKLGANLFFAYNVVGLVFSLILVVFLFRFYQLLLRNLILSTLSLNLFLLSGGLGFIHFFSDIAQKGWQLIWHIPKEYTLLPDLHIRWINIVTSEIIPQRALVLGFIVGLYILSTTYHFYLTRTSTPFHFFLSGVLFGLLPVIHPHTMIVISLYTIWFFWITRKHKLTILWIYFLVPALLISLPIFFFHLFPSINHQFLTYYPGWLAKPEKTNWIYFWIQNWGLFLPLALIGVFIITPHQRNFIFPFFILFIFANLFIFQPHDWDNSKLLTWVYFAFTPLVATTLHRLYHHSSLDKAIALILIFSLTASGFIDVIRQLQPQTSVHMYTAEELYLDSFVRSHTSAGSIFATSDNHTHFIPVLSGRQILMGYYGWLWSYGIDYQNRKQMVALIYSGGELAKFLLHLYSVDYLVIGPHEQYNLNPNQVFFETHYQKLIQTQNYTIFDINKPKTLTSP